MRSHALWRTVCCIMFVACAATQAAAQLPGLDNQRRFIRIGFGGGFSVPTSQAGDVLQNGINGQAFVLLDPGLGIPLRFNVGYQKFDFDDTALGALSGETTILSGVAGTTFDLFRLGPVRPYLTAGLGAFNVRDRLESGADASTQSDLRFGIDGGAGLGLRFGRLEGFIEARIQNVYTDQGAIETKSIRSVPVTFGLLF